VFYQGLIFFLGFCFLCFGSNVLVGSSLRFSYLLKLSPLFIGITVIAFGTSTPEAAVSIISAINNHKEIALGNIIGSNIANLGLILSVAALIRPIKIQRYLFKGEILIMFFSSCLLTFVVWDGVLTRLDGVVFLFLFVVFMFFSFKHRSADIIKIDQPSKEFSNISSKLILGLILTVSLIMVIAGAQLMVSSGVKIAVSLGINPLIIGLTVFAIGTSLPELAASITAALKGNSDIGMGNVIGSNIFNILFILGIVSFLRPVIINPQLIHKDLIFLLFFSLFVFIFKFTNYYVSRRTAVVLLIGYFYFVASVFLK